MESDGAQLNEKLFMSEVLWYGVCDAKKKNRISLTLSFRTEGGRTEWRPIRRDKGCQYANPPEQRSGLSRGKSAGTAVREQLRGQFARTVVRPIFRDSCAANPPGHPIRQSAGREARPILRCCQSAETGVLGQLCGQFDGTEALPICRDSCVANPPGQLCGQSAGITALPIRRDNLRSIRWDSNAGLGNRGAANPGRRDSGAGTAVRPIRWSIGTAARLICRDSCVANPPGQPCGRSARIPIRRDSSAGDRGAVNPGRRDSGAGTAVRPIYWDSSAARQLCSEKKF
jgi:hypothetical protein